jgi:hypothetical protein
LNATAGAFAGAKGIYRQETEIRRQIRGLSVIRQSAPTSELILLPDLLQNAGRRIW